MIRKVIPISFFFLRLHILYVYLPLYQFVVIYVWPSYSSLYIDVGYRIEAVKSGVSRITMIYSFNPQGHLAQHPYFAKKMENQFIQSLPGLRDMLCQIPDYHILNLIERIIKGIRSISSESSNSSGMVSLQFSL